MSVITCTFTSFHTSLDKSKQYFDLKDNTVLLIHINHKSLIRTLPSIQTSHIKREITLLC